jgi:hypothetical protein
MAYGCATMASGDAILIVGRANYSTGVRVLMYGFVVIV